MEFFFYFHCFTESVCFFNRHYAKLKKYENSNRYRASKEAKEAILSCYRDLLLHFPTDKPGVKVLRRFDDLCLFSRGKLFLGTVSHEYQVCLYPLTIQMRSIVTSLQMWHPCTWCNESDRRNIHKYNWTDEPS